MYRLTRLIQPAQKTARLISSGMMHQEWTVILAECVDLVGSVLPASKVAPGQPLPQLRLAAL